MSFNIRLILIIIFTAKSFAEWWISSLLTTSHKLRSKQDDISYG